MPHGEGGKIRCRLRQITLASCFPPAQYYPNRLQYSLYDKMNWDVALYGATSPNTVGYYGNRVSSGWWRHALGDAC